MSAEAILDRASQFLADEDNWLQGDLVNFETGARCALGAIDLAQEELGLTREQNVEAHYALARVVYDRYGTTSVPGWNDDPFREHSEIVTMFEKARAHAAEHKL